MERTQKIRVKGMVCGRCILTVEQNLQSMGILPRQVLLGEIVLTQANGKQVVSAIQERLLSLGFTVIEDKGVAIVNRIKQLVEEVYSGNYDFPNRFRFSELVSETLNKDYDALSAMFTSATRTNLEKYIIEYRVERVKEFLAHTSFPLSEISFRLGYSSVPHLSRQFKNVTGVTPSDYRALKMPKMNQEVLQEEYENS